MLYKFVIGKLDYLEFNLTHSTAKKLHTYLHVDHFCVRCIILCSLGVLGTLAIFYIVYK